MTSKLRGIICDLDGTLYRQRPVRIRMLLKLLQYYTVHIWKWRELYGIYLFRKMREKEHFKELSFLQQLQQTGKKAHMETDKLRAAVQTWMFDVPLALIVHYQNEGLISYLKEQQEKGVQLIIYSDYPVEQKLECLNIQADDIFYPGMNGIDSMKPSKRAMDTILHTVGISPEKMIFIGDREDKDGKSAELVGMAFATPDYYKTTSEKGDTDEKVY